MEVKTVFARRHYPGFIFSFLPHKICHSMGCDFFASNTTTAPGFHIQPRAKLSRLVGNLRGKSQQGQLHQQDLWSGRWESNPRPKLGKLLYCHCTTPAHCDCRDYT
jgi:hypothetical protein